LPAAKVDKKMMHQSTSTAGDKEVGGRRRRRKINRGGGPVRQEAVEQGEAEVATQQPVKADIERQQQDNGQKCRQIEGGGVLTCNATTSQDSDDHDNSNGNGDSISDGDC
jgi:hypothetical protein